MYETLTHLHAIYIYIYLYIYIYEEKKTWPVTPLGSWSMSHGKISSIKSTPFCGASRPMKAMMGCGKKENQGKQKKSCVRLFSID